MEQPQPEREAKPTERPRVNPASELRNLQTNGSASMAELREFLGKLQGRKPQEVIGIVSASLLIQSLAISTFATLALLVVFTVGPYLIYGPPQAKPTAAKPAPAVEKKSESNSAPQSESAGTDGKPSPPAATPNLEKAVKTLGLDETKAADPNKNPLDNPNLDKLLDGIDK